MGRGYIRKQQVFEDIRKMQRISARKKYVTWIDQKFVKLLDVQ